MTRVRPRRPSRRATRRGLVLSAAGALALAAGLVWQSAYAGFTDTTANLTASVGTGTVVLTNEIEGLAALSLPDMRPGQSFTECIAVTYTGAPPATVKLYGKDRSQSATGLTSNITFSWTAGTGGGVNDDCAGFVAGGVTTSTSMSSFPTSFGSGQLAWNTNGGGVAEKRTYRFTYSLSSSAPASVKGASAAITFVWEAQQR